MVLEIVIVAVIVLLLFGYKKLPQLGRSAGEGVNQLKGSVGEMVGDRKLDPQSLGRSAGRGVREAREFKDALTGSAQPTDDKPKPRKPATERPAAEQPAADQPDMRSGDRPAD